MKIKSAILLGFLFISVPAAAQTMVTAGAGGIYPPGTTFNSVPINALEFGFGLEIAEGGSAVGQFTTVLVGLSLAGIEQRIVIEGTVSSGSKSAANIATFSGTCSVNMGDGAPPTPGVPFTATVTTDANDQGTLGLVIGLNNLPNASVSEGSQTIN